MRLRFEVEGVPGETPLPNDGADLVAFLSFAVSRGFGAEHPLALLADRLHDRHAVPFGPLTTFYEADTGDREDEEKLDMAWQEPSGLLSALRRMHAAFGDDTRLRELLVQAGAESLPGQVEALFPPLAKAVRSGARVRLSYSL